MLIDLDGETQKGIFWIQNLAKSRARACVYVSVGTIVKSHFFDRYNLYTSFSNVNLMFFYQTKSYLASVDWNC